LNSGANGAEGSIPALASGGTPYPAIALTAGNIEPVYPRLAAWSSINACETTCPAWSVYTGRTGENWDIFRQDSMAAQPVNISRLNQDNVNITPDNLMPSLSPNGKWVVFASNRDKYWELYISSTDGTVLPRRLTYSKGLERNPVWSPGGQNIVYESNRDGNWELYLADISSGKEKRLTFSDGDDTHARWSPDASRIVFESNRSGRSQIYQLDLQTDLVTTLSDGKTDDSQPVYAADGRHIAYRSIHPDNPNGLIMILATDGTGASVISDSSQDAINPVWSSKGKLLAYEVLQGGTQAIYGYDATTGTTRQLISAELNAYAPTWGCDGTTLVVNIGTGDTSNIYVLDKLLTDSSPVNATDQLAVLSNSPAGKIYDPFIAPNGKAWEQTEQ
jgi:Tol biopolymer transport system component